MESFFIIADDIQLTTMGKTIVIGLYSDQIIMLHVHGNRPPNSTPSVAKLNMMLTFRGLKPGQHDVQADLQFPDGTPAPNLATVALDVQKGRSAVLIFAFAPFPLPQEGPYRLRVRVAGQTVVNTFTVIYEPLTPAFAAAHGIPLAAPTVAAPASEKVAAKAAAGRSGRAIAVAQGNAEAVPSKTAKPLARVPAARSKFILDRVKVLRPVGKPPAAKKKVHKGKNL